MKRKPWPEQTLISTSKKLKVNFWDLVKSIAQANRLGYSVPVTYQFATIFLESGPVFKQNLTGHGEGYDQYAGFVGLETVEACLNALSFYFDVERLISFADDVEFSYTVTLNLAACYLNCADFSTFQKFIKKHPISSRPAPKHLINKKAESLELIRTFKLNNSIAWGRQNNSERARSILAKHKEDLLKIHGKELNERTVRNYIDEIDS